jgi:hypothetical protein
VATEAAWLNGNNLEKGNKEEEEGKKERKNERKALGHSQGEALAASEALAIASETGGHQWWEVNWRLRSSQRSYVQSYELFLPE